MAQYGGLHNTALALQYKESGNAAFNKGDWVGAESYYTKAITHDQRNVKLYTNRAFTYIKMEAWGSVIDDCRTSIEIEKYNMKGYYYLAQAQVALHEPHEAYKNAKRAHEICVEEGSVSNLAPLTQLVLRCKKEEWEAKERARLRERGGLLMELEDLLESAESRLSRNLSDEAKVDLEKEYDSKMSLLRTTFEVAKLASGEDKKRVVPDWIIDGISFSVMVDPVVTKSGRSYDRVTVTEHLKNNPVDPLTREPMTIADLRPNIALKEAIEEFLNENGWAVDY